MRERRLAWTFCTVIAALFSLWLAAAMPASAGVDEGEFGICHATGSQSNPLVFIGPDDQSFEAHLEHIGPGGGDRFATEAEFDAGLCEGQTATEVPTEEPTEVPGTEEPTEEPVSTLPDTGSLPGGGSEQGVGQELVLVSAVAAVLFLGAAGWMTARSRRHMF